MIKRENIIWWLILTFAVVYGFWSVTKHNQFRTDAIDLAIFDQPLWHYSRLEVPLSTVKYNQSPGEHILGDHFHPLLALLSPLYWLWDDVRILLIAQAIFAAVSVWPIYQIAQLKLGRRSFSLAVSFAYLTFIGLQTALDYDFHETVIALLPFSLAIYFLLRGRIWAYFLSLAAAMLLKEDMPLFVATLGLFSAIELREIRLGVVTFFLGISSYLLITQVAIPIFKHDRFAYEELDPRLGKTTLDLIRTTWTNPLLVAETLFLPVLKTKTILNLLASFSFLPLLSPTALLMALPNLASRFLTRLSQRWLIRFQYNAILTPVMALAVIFGLSKIKRVKFLERRFNLLLNLASILLIMAPIVQTIRTNSPLLRILSSSSYKFDERFFINYHLLARIPKDANVSVMAQSSFVPHLSHRYKIYRFEDGLVDKSHPEYILMSADEASDPPYVRHDLEDKIDTLKRNPSYEVLFWDGIRLLMRLKGGRT